LAYVCFIWTASMAVFGWDVVRRVLFPLAFLVFIVPFPDDLTRQIESFFQYTSADAASLLLGMSQTPVLRDGLFFALPGITLEVAQECSGIRSTLVLFITSLVGGYMFFELRRYRAILALVVIPIAIFRNGLRIFTIAMLCVHVGPEMIHSLIHRRGGPLFFALSLVPFFALLIFLYRRERKLRIRALPTL
jgi:exosortase C (VPDSG-CTERM-specific)